MRIHRTHPSPVGPGILWMACALLLAASPGAAQSCTDDPSPVAPVARSPVSPNYLAYKGKTIALVGVSHEYICHIAQPERDSQYCTLTSYPGVLANLKDKEEHRHPSVDGVQPQPRPLLPGPEVSPGAGRPLHRRAALQVHERQVGLERRRQPRHQPDQSQPHLLHEPGSGGPGGFLPRDHRRGHAPRYLGWRLGQRSVPHGEYGQRHGFRVHQLGAPALPELRGPGRKETSPRRSWPPATPRRWRWQAS